MNGRKLLILSFGFLLICQIAAAQSSPNIEQLAALAARIGKPLPVVPQSSVAAGHVRPHIWISAQMPNSGAQAGTLPTFCDVPNSRGGFNFCPDALQTAYGVPFKKTNAGTIKYDGTGITIAIVDAFHYANNSADLDFFNAEMNLPPCTTASGCFSNFDQNGGHNFCGSDSGWELETMLDIEWAHAMAPGAKIVLVEGCTNEDSDLATAVTTAVGKADILSNSYGELEFSGETSFDPVYNVNKPILFSSGDNGTPTSYPCASPYVTCVGGTTLKPNTTTFVRITETGWAGSGGGCSSQEALPGYQATNGVTLCSPHRATPDVAATADPDWGVIVYDSGNGGHFRVGGTSVASPVTAGVYADVMQARHKYGQMDPLLYTAGCHGTANCVGPNQINAYYYYDILTGNNGLPAGPGYDMVTGMGVSNGAHMGGLFGLP